MTGALGQPRRAASDLRWRRAVRSAVAHDERVDMSPAGNTRSQGGPDGTKPHAFGSGRGVATVTGRQGSESASPSPTSRNPPAMALSLAPGSVLANGKRYLFHASAEFLAGSPPRRSPQSTGGRALHRYTPFVRTRSGRLSGRSRTLRSQAGEPQACARDRPGAVRPAG